MRQLSLPIAAAAFALLSAYPALAAETVSVELLGERGGAMSIKLDKSSVPAGEVTFQVANVAKNTPHEMVVVKVDKAGQRLEVDRATNRVDESKLDSKGEVSNLKAGQDGTLTVNLAPGSYELICNLKGHVMAGMVVSFTVTG
ncbi:sulfocyanin-like copper-binding protein [Aureimonas sp. ME7]|uniref:sulfocyanin-like copper-binding protein n=1 Tax=Aureimonas sp. ME7 TaxID=2744252 RepID=UPI0015F4F39F|nr:sulfocyanin-like copper-binding protein [Aureimonas sp. ME7]